MAKVETALLSKLIALVMIFSPLFVASGRQPQILQAMFEL
jgi:hypothetical protein